MADDDKLKLGKPQGDPLRLDYPDPVSESDRDTGRPNAARIHRRSRQREEIVDEIKETHYPEPTQVTE